MTLEILLWHPEKILKASCFTLGGIYSCRFALGFKLLNCDNDE